MTYVQQVTKYTQKLWRRKVWFQRILFHDSWEKWETRFIAPHGSFHGTELLTVISKSPYVRWRTPCLCLPKVDMDVVSRYRWRLGLVVAQEKGKTVLRELSVLPFSGIALSQFLPCRSASSDPRATVSCLCGSALLAAEPPSPCELLPSIHDVRVAWNDQGWSDTIHHSSTPGLSPAVWSPFASELLYRQGQLHEMTRSLSFQCCFPAQLLWQPRACKSYPQEALSPCLQLWAYALAVLWFGDKAKGVLGSGQGNLYLIFVGKLVVCRIIHGRTGCSADCSEHCSIAPKTFNGLALKPLMNAISFPGSWQAMTMALGRPVCAPPCLSTDWQWEHVGAGLIRKCKCFCEKLLFFFLWKNFNESALYV